MQLSSVQKDNEIYFIGGYNGLSLSDLIEVYNTNTETWMPPDYLSSPRSFTACVAGDSAIYVAGGIENLSNPVVGTNKVDIFKNGVWTTHLLQDSFFTANAVHVGNKLLFAGGAKSYNSSTGVIEVSATVEVFDELSGIWSTDTLSQARGQVAAASDGTIAVFAGGIIGNNQPSDVVDIYNSLTDTWTTASLSEGRTNITGINCNGKFYFAGGAKAGIFNSSDVVDVYDGSSWNVDYLSTARAGVSACASGDNIIFSGGGDIDLVNWNYVSSSSLVDVYNTVSGTWSTNNMNYTKINHTSISAGGKVYVAGGYDITLSTPLDAVEVWDLLTAINAPESHESVSVYPNPAIDYITVSNHEKINPILTLNIKNYMNQLLETKINSKEIIDISTLAPGLYFLEIIKSNAMITKAFVKE